MGAANETEQVLQGGLVQILATSQATMDSGSGPSLESKKWSAIAALTSGAANFAWPSTFLSVTAAVGLLVSVLHFLIRASSFLRSVLCSVSLSSRPAVS
jgi:hypothetical protein